MEEKDLSIENEINFENFCSFSLCPKVKEKNNTVEDWQADFQQCFLHGHGLVFSLEKKEYFQNVFKNCFSTSQFESNKSSAKDLWSQAESNLSTLLHRELHDPIKASKTLFHTLMLDTVRPVLNTSQSEVNWLKNLRESKFPSLVYCFDFHKSDDSSPHSFKTKHKNSHKTKSDEIHATENHTLQNEQNGGKEVLERSTVKNEDHHFQLKELFEEPSMQSISDIQSVIFDLNSQVTIYSEQLLAELNNRECLRRQNEIQNTFIAAYLKFEQKLCEINKKKKNKYSFFRFTDDISQNGNEFSIPYLNHRHGPSYPDLLALTKILTAIQNNDVDVPNLITRYIVELGNDILENNCSTHDNGST